MRKNYQGILILLFCSTFFMILLFKPVLKNPDGFVVSDTDALKSYYNFSWYLKYGQGFKHDGINYPYGDHIMYTNTHPLYVTIAKFIDKNIYPLENGVGMINLAMIFSLVLATPFIFLILRSFYLPFGYSILITLIITYLSPQFVRMAGHFEMVYAFFIPMLWYFLIRWQKADRKWIWVILIMVLSAIGGFTSAFYAAFFSIFMFSLFMVELWDKRKRIKENRKKLLVLLFMAVFPVLLVKGVVGITDWAIDRPENPWGFFKFHTTIFGVFTPPDSKLYKLLNLFFNWNTAWEGRAYVGLPGSLLAFSIVLSFFYFFLTSRKYDYRFFFPEKNLNKYLAASVIVLLFSMAFPFRLGMSFLLEWVPPIKQFRALGRFSWIFYYVFSTYTAVFLWKLYRRLRFNKLPFLAVVLLFLSAGFWLIDSGMNTFTAQKDRFQDNRIFDTDPDELSQFMENHGINSDDYQALIFLPFANTCGDKLLFTTKNSGYQEGLKVSFRTGIPIIQSLAPRIPFSNALSCIQLLSDEGIPVERLNDMGTKPILVIGKGNEFNEAEKNFLGYTTPIAKFHDLQFSSLEPDRLKQKYPVWQKRTRRMFDEKDPFSKEIVDTSKEVVIHWSFDEMESEHTFAGNGAFYLRKGKSDLIKSDDISSEMQGFYNLTFWVFFEVRQYGMPEPIWYEYGSNGKQIQRTKVNYKAEHNVFNNWVRFDKEMVLAPGNKYKLEIKGERITIDELILKPQGINTFVRTDKEYDLFNNYPLLKN